jgi:hypothetical protein
MADGRAKNPTLESRIRNSSANVDNPSDSDILFFIRFYQ